MRSLGYLLVLVGVLPVAAQTKERLGTVSFPAPSCAAAAQVPFNRGVALLHDFWYEEARHQFEEIAQSDAGCALAHWGAAMSLFHEIWGRPGAPEMKKGWADMQKAQALPVNTERERAYIAALAHFYQPGSADFPARVAAYSAEMGRLSAHYPDDVDAGAFYALSLLAAKTPGDASLSQEHKALAVLTPLAAKYPDNPGIVHYIIHSCDNPAMASEGLAAADHYGEIAPSGAHAFHMPGHIYARLGLWPQDIASQLGSIQAAQEAESHGKSGMMDEPHSYDFLLYAYLQTGQDERAQATLAESDAPLKMIDAMPDMGVGRMAGMVPYYRVKLQIFYALERRDWKSAARLEPLAGSPPDVALLVYWARAVAHGRLREPALAKADIVRYDQAMAEVKKGKSAYIAEGTAAKIEYGEMLAWSAFAQGRQDEALANMRTAADLQDKVGQGEVDIPAREMLADMLLEFGQAEKALAEYKVALQLSPNRLNGLYSAGRAAEAAGQKEAATFYYVALLKSTNNGQDSSRPELAHARSFVSSRQTAER